MIAFRYYGGKNSHLDWLLPLLPTDGVEHYVEPFCGSCAVLLNRPLVPFETINDLSGRVVNFFRVLRERPDELLRVLEATPYAEAELILSRESSEDELEEARRFVVGLQMSFAQNGESLRIATKVRQNTSPPVAFQNCTKDYSEIAQRLRNVQILGPGDGISLIERCDSPATLFYLDPPYVHEARNGKGYLHEMTTADHERLLETLLAIKGRAALSGYASELYDKALSGWNRIERNVRSTIGKEKLSRTEVLWTNYDPIAQDLFAGAM